MQMVSNPVFRHVTGPGSFCETTLADVRNLIELESTIRCMCESLADFGGPWPHGITGPEDEFGMGPVWTVRQQFAQWPADRLLPTTAARSVTLPLVYRRT